MRWVALLLTALALGSCAAPSGLPPTTIELAPPRDPAQADPSEPAATSVPQIEPTASSGFRASLPDLGAAPELHNAIWLNTVRPLRLADLQGKVVLLDMWTFGCINCRNVIPSLRAWHTKYAKQGLVVIGNHFPEFNYERDLGNLKDALQQLNVPYAVAQDNDGSTWRAYGARYWPSLFLIDKRGHLRYTHIGEGAYGETEQAIRDLLRED
jgi:thiol-disulfide isomerase/thioredoxin